MLRIEIAGVWTAKDFANFYKSINDIYSIFVVILIEIESAKDFNMQYIQFLTHESSHGRIDRKMYYELLERQRYTGFGYGPIDISRFRDASELLENSEKLKVRRCEYASPGATDFTGIGQALGHLKDLILKCIDARLTRNERNIKNEILEHERDSAALKNLQARLSILKELGYSRSQIRKILMEASPALAKLESLAQHGLITDASTLDTDG